MSWEPCGACPQCGAPIYVESVSFSILPPAPHYTCACRASATGVLITTSTTTTAQTNGWQEIGPRQGESTVCFFP